MQTTPARSGTAPRLLKCASCGAENSPGTSLTSTCEWCGGALVHGMPQSAKPELVAPLQIDEARARAAMELWLRNSHEDIPPEFERRARIINITCTFWPFYYFTGVYSGWRGSGTISGGFSEFIPASTELLAIRMQAPAFRFFTPPTGDVTLEDLGDRIMAELFEDHRATVHVDFCRKVIRHATTAPLREYGESYTDGSRLVSFTEPYEAAELRLKQLLSDHSKARDIFFQQLTSKRALWPFWMADVSYRGIKYLVFLDGASPDGKYIGGYKPVLPDKANLPLNRLLTADPDEMISAWTAAGLNGGVAEGEINWRTVQKIADVAGTPLSGVNTSVDVKRSCFIATAAYGSEWSGEVEVLRRYRDRVLLNSDTGRRMVDLYYRVSPRAAKFISGSGRRRQWARAMLSPIVRWCRRQIEP